MARDPPSALRETVVVVPPPPGVRGVVCGIWRELSGEGAAPGHVPANVYGCLNHVASGEVHLADGTRLPGSFVTGPMSRPLATSARAPLRSASIVFEPWLLDTWFGVPVGDAVGGWVEVGARGAQGPALRALTPQAAASPDALAAALRACADLPVPGDADRLAAVLAARGSVAAAADEFGVGERQFERRFKASYGLPPRRWLVLRSYESALVCLADGSTSLAAAAAASGFADQAHMSRRFREVAARTPAEARRALAAGRPGDWPLQPARRTSRR